MSRLGVFGGTFDPVHVGHLAIANAALEDIPLDRVLFVPARRSPLKDAAPVATVEDRVAMLERAIGGEARFAICRAEIDRPAPSYTVDTLEALRRDADDELYLIIGSDAYAAFARWKDPARIRALAHLVVAARPGAPAPKDARLLDAPLMDISAHELRARAARGRSLRYLVPEATLRYIEERHLYR